MLDGQFTEAFEAAVNNKENRLEDGSVNWNFVDSDLCLNGWMEKLGVNYMAWFDDMANEFEMNGVL